MGDGIGRGWGAAGAGEGWEGWDSVAECLEGRGWCCGGQGLQRPSCAMQPLLVVCAGHCCTRRRWHACVTACLGYSGGGSWGGQATCRQHHAAGRMDVGGWPFQRMSSTLWAAMMGGMGEHHGGSEGRRAPPLRRRRQHAAHGSRRLTLPCACVCLPSPVCSGGRKECADSVRKFKIACCCRLGCLALWPLSSPPPR